jgi:transcriptional regulator with XRE-family HTH domain
MTLVADRETYTGMLQQPWFGQRLRELRMARGLSQAALAEPGVSVSYLSRLESGARPPTARAVAYLSERLGVPPSELGDHRASEFAQVVAKGFAVIEDLDPAIKRDLVHNDRAELDIDPALQWQVLWSMAETRGDTSDPVRKKEILDALMAVGDGIGIPELRVRARVKLSQFYRVTGHPEVATELAHAATDIARGFNAPAIDLARALLTLVSAEGEAGDIASARRAADELIEIIDSAGTVVGPLVAEARWAAATVRLRQGLPDEATVLIESAIRDLDSHDDIILWMRLRIAAGSLYLQMNPKRTGAASQRISEIESLVPLIGTRQHLQEFMTIRALLAFHEGRLDDARRIADNLAREPSLMSFRDQIRVDILRFRLQVASGDIHDAMEKLTALAHRLQDSANAELAAEAWRALAEPLSPTSAQPSRD